MLLSLPYSFTRTYAHDQEPVSGIYYLHLFKDHWLWRQWLADSSGESVIWSSFDSCVDIWQKPDYCMCKSMWGPMQRSCCWTRCCMLPGIAWPAFTLSYTNSANLLRLFSTGISPTSLLRTLHSFLPRGDCVVIVTCQGQQTSIHWHNQRPCCILPWQGNLPWTQILQKIYYLCVMDRISPMHCSPHFVGDEYRRDLGRTGFII